MAGVERSAEVKKEENKMGKYYGRFISGGEMVAVGRFIGGAFSLYNGKDGKFRFDPRYESMYYDGEFDEITDEEAEKFMKEMDEM